MFSRSKLMPGGRVPKPLGPPDPTFPIQQIRDLATCRFVDRHASLLICGPVGVGKTHVARAIGVEACRRGYVVLFTKTARLLRDLAGGHADGSWEQRFRAYLRAEVLILDDFAMQEFTGSQDEDLYQLIDERVAARSSLPRTGVRRTGIPSSRTRCSPRASWTDWPVRPISSPSPAKATGHGSAHHRSRC